MEIKIEINSCQDCPKWRRARFWTSDSWEEAYDWFCTACKDKDDPSQDRKIQGYVEWHDVKGITIPAWCPNKL